MDYAKLPRAFEGELQVTPDEFTLEATRLIVHADKVSFECSGADGNGGAFTVSAVADRTGNGTFLVHGVKPEYKTTVACPVGEFEFLVVEIKVGEAEDATEDRCFVKGVWREKNPSAEWEFSGTLVPFKST
ncbi:MAG: hypothetical protein K2X51_18970 [Burkholderiales bacterium]|nr:hypothetical protein [Burkholderiales bacterium]